jgi:hypothetical protein
MPVATWKLGVFVSFRSGASLRSKRCVKLNCTTPRTGVHPFDRFGVRWATLCAMASSGDTVNSAMAQNAATPASVSAEFEVPDELPFIVVHSRSERCVFDPDPPRGLQEVRVLDVSWLSPRIPRRGNVLDGCLSREGNLTTPSSC